MVRRGRRSRRGLTLIEVVIAVAIAAMATGIAVGAINSITDAALKSTSIELAGAIKYSYDRAIMERRTQRLSIDMDKGLWWIDFTTDPFALASERDRGREGAKGEEAGGKEAKKEEKSIFDDDEDDGGRKEVEAALEGGKAASFTMDADLGPPRSLPGDVKFSKVWTGHQEEAFTSGVAYLHFFSGGWTEPAQIELTDGDSHITVKVYPLTGRVRMYDKELEVPRVEDDDGRDEGDE
jgi:general secretion pathway protein H